MSHHKPPLDIPMRIQQQFRNLLTDVPAGVTVFRGREFMVEMANKTYLEIVDKTEEELVGKPFFDVLPDLRQSVEALLTGVLLSGEPYYGYEFPVTLNRYGKSEVSYFNFVYQPARDEDGTTTGIIVLANEVTPTVRAKQLLAESEKQFRNLVMQAPIAMAIFRGADHIIEMANTIMFEKIWRRKAEDVIGQKVLDVFPELREQRFPALLNDVLTTGKIYQEAEALAIVQGNDGFREFYLDFQYAPLLDPEGGVSGVMITVNDVTERVLARKELEIAEERARLAVLSADLGVFELDISSNIVITDERFNAIYEIPSGLTRDDLIRRMHPEDLPGREIAHSRALRDGNLHFEARLVFGTRIKWIKVSGKVYFDGERRPIKLLGVIQDVTEHKQSVSELEHRVRDRTIDLVESNRQLERSNEDLLQFAHVASHDLKEPVRKIKTFSYRLRDDFGDVLGERGGNYLSKIIHSTTRMYSMIDAVLNYSSLTALDQPMHQVDLNKIVDSILVDLEVLIGEKSATIVNEGLPVIDGMPDLIYQLFYNLINNSLKFAKADVPARINLRYELPEKASGYDLKIVLTDNGVGFNQVFAEKIFSTFHRLHSKDKYEGTGLGLALCKKIVERHGGQIFASGQEGNGAEFIILLPQNNSRGE